MRARDGGTRTGGSRHASTRLLILPWLAVALGAAAPRDGFEWSDAATFVAVAIGILIVRRALRRRMTGAPTAHRD